MKRLTKSEITRLRKAAIGLVDYYQFSCVAVKKTVNNKMSNRYAESMGVDRYRPAERENDIADVKWQLARSLAVLMFIEMNR